MRIPPYIYIATSIALTSCSEPECTRLSDCAPGICLDGTCISETPTTPPPTTPLPVDAGVSADAGPTDGGPAPDAGASDGGGQIEGEELPSAVILEWSENAETVTAAPGFVTVTLENRSGARFEVSRSSFEAADSQCLLERTRLVRGVVVPLPIVQIQVLTVDGPNLTTAIPLDGAAGEMSVPAVFDDALQLGLTISGDELVELGIAREAASGPPPPRLENLTRAPARASTSSIAYQWLPSFDADLVELRIEDPALNLTMTCSSPSSSGRLTVPSEALEAWRSQSAVTEATLRVVTEAGGEIAETSGSRYPVLMRMMRQLPVSIVAAP